MTSGILEKKLDDGVFRAEIDDGGWKTTPESKPFEAAYPHKGYAEWDGTGWVIAFWKAVEDLDAEVVQEPEIDDVEDPEKMTDNGGVNPLFDRFTEGKPRKEYSTTQLQVPHAVSKLLTKLCAAIDPDDLSDKGLEDDHHVTVLYGITDDDVPDSLAHILSNRHSFNVFCNRASVFKRPECDVLKINVSSGEIEELHREVAATVSHDPLHDSYVPHITLAYLKPGTGEKYTNITNELMGEPVRLSRFVFSNRDRERTEFSLGGLAKFTEIYHGPKPPGDLKNWRQMPQGPRGGKRWQRVKNRTPQEKPAEKKPAAKQDTATKTKPRPMTEKAKRAVSAHVMVDKEIQRYAEERNEPQFAIAVRGVSMPDNEPVDVMIGEGGVVKHGCELKTMVKNTNNKITMDTYSQVRKHLWRANNKSTFHTVVIDDREVYDQTGKGKHNDSKRKYYYRRGISGSARIENLHVANSIGELKKLMDMPEDKLPDQAKPTDQWIREGTWKAFQDKDGKGFKNSKSGYVVRAKK